MSINLREIGNEIATQDNAGTEYPLFCVYQKQDVVVSIDHDYDRIEFFDEDHEEADEGQKPLLEKLYELGELPGGWNRYAIKEIDVFVTACFTRKRCEDYLRANSHNLNKPFVYVNSLYRNQEMIELREFLLSHKRIVEFPEGFIEWNGGDCPVPVRDKVDIFTVSGHFNTESMAGVFRWDHVGADDDIIGYRVGDKSGDENE